MTLPIAGAGSSSPLEIKQPELATYSHDQYLRLSDAKDGVRFRAHAGGVTTSNSGYPRSELREMTNDGGSLAAWSTSAGTHTLIIRQAITHLPVAKPHVVAGQVHDSSDDVVMVRLEGKHLFVEGNGKELGTLDASYVLGTVFTTKLLVSGGRIRVFHNDMNTPQVTLSIATSGCYFKAGAYTQSNASRGDDASAYGEVVIYDLSVTHE